jgi:hypothetical protein
MLHAEQVEELICIVAEMNRASLITQFRSYPSRFPVDFTREFLETQSIERLRHIFVALCLQQQRMPDFAIPQAA